MDIREEMINRLLRIIEHFSRKLRIALYLPMLLKKDKFRRFCKQHHVKEIRKFYELYERTKLMSEQSGDVDPENESKQIVLYQDENNKIETHMPVVLENLLRYEHELSSMTIDDEDDEDSKTCQETLRCIEQLKQAVEWQMRMTPKQVRERKVELRNAEILIIRTKEDIEKLENDFNEETSKHEEIVEKSREEIKRFSEIIDETKRKHKKKLNRDKNSYERSLRGLRNDVAEEEDNLHSQVKAYEAMLEKLTLMNLEHEKHLRGLCIEAEQKHIIARNTYDRDLSKLDELKETLQTQLSVLTGHFEILKNEYEVQSVLYLNLKKERELALMQAFAEQLDNFEKNRAARIIQRTWRAYHERVAAKQKKKRGRKAK